MVGPILMVDPIAMEDHIPLVDPVPLVHLNSMSAIPIVHGTTIVFDAGL